MAISLIPIWAVRSVPTQDGPLHLYNAVMLRDYHRADRSAFREFFLPNNSFVPNMICPQLLPLLTRVASARVAEKLLLSAYLITLPLAVRFALRGISLRAGWLALLAVPWGLNQFLYYGFEDFTLSLVGYFIVAGCWFRIRGHRSVAAHIGLALLLLLLYFTHLASLVMVLPLIGLTAISELAPIDQPWPKKVWWLAPVAVAMLPVLLLALSFTLEPHGHLLVPDYPIGWRHPRFLLDWMIGLSHRERAPATIELLTMLGLSLWLIPTAARSWDREHLARGLAATVIFYLLVFFISPDALAGGRVLIMRAAAYPMFALLFWMAALPLDAPRFGRLRRVGGIGATIALVWLAQMQLSRSLVLNRYLAEYDAIAPMIPAGATLVPVHFQDWQQTDILSADRSRPLQDEIDVFRHAEARGLAERGVIDLCDHWASTDHHSVLWKPGLDPMTPLIDAVDDFLGYEARTGRRVDFVLFRDGGVPHTGVQAKLIASELRFGYQRIYTSPSGNLALYRHVDAK